MDIESLTEPQIKRLELLHEHGYLRAFFFDAMNYSHEGPRPFVDVMRDVDNTDNIEDLIDTAICWSDTDHDWGSVSRRLQVIEEEREIF